MSVNTIYNMHTQMTLAVPQPGADGARITNCNGDHVDVYYDAEVGKWVLMASCPVELDTQHSVTTIGKR